MSLLIYGGGKRKKGIGFLMRGVERSQGTPGTRERLEGKKKKDEGKGKGITRWMNEIIESAKHHADHIVSRKELQRPWRIIERAES